MKANIKLVETLVFERFIHVVAPAEGKPARVQAANETGKLSTVACTPAIWQRVLGTRSADPKELRFHLGLRQLTRVKFRAHLDAKGTVQCLDIIPNRFFTSGAAPRAAGKAAKTGFEVHWDEELQGYDVWTDNDDTGDRDRIAYNGMSEIVLCEVLDALRNFAWGSKKSATIKDHKVDRTDDMTYRIRPLKDIKHTT